MSELLNSYYNNKYNKYIGARYIPIFAGAWDNKNKYEPLVVVEFQGASYTSKTFVPVGVDINNTTYWVLSGNYNAQVEAYRQIVNSVNNEVSNAREGKETLTENLNAIKADLNENIELVDTEVIEKAKKSESMQPLIFGGNVSNKLISQVGTHLFVVTKKANEKGYIRYRLRDDLVDTSPSSAGGTGNLQRVVEVFNAPECFTIVKNGVKSTTGWATDNNVSYGGIQIPVYVTNATISGAYVEYNIVIPSGKYACEILAYGSTGSSENVNISLDGTDVRNVSFRQTTGKWFRFGIPCTPGNHTVRITVVDQGYISVAGANIVDLDKYSGENYDTVYTVYEGSINQYITNGGAIDYAMQDINNLYYGSYHGGEIRLSIKHILDGSTINPSDGSYFIGKQFEVLQTTSIKEGSLIANSRYLFKYDGIQEFEVTFEGSMKLKKLFTNMCTTQKEYKLVLFPKNVTTQANGAYYFNDGVNKIIQMNSANNQKITSILNSVSYPTKKVINPYIQVSEFYNKVYRENILDETGIDFTGGNFFSAHIFE